MAGLIKELDIVIGSAKLQADHPELFHYTRPEGFRAIIGSQTLWATLFRDLKDQQEIRVLKPALRATIVDLFDKAVAKRSRAVRRRFDHCGGATFQADKFVDSVYKSTFERNDLRFAVDAFTTSFTAHAADLPFERENGLLSQWTEYAPDGFCIVLDTIEMCRLLGLEFDARDYTHLNLEPIRYAFKGVPLREHFPDLEPALNSSIEQFLGHPGRKTAKRAIRQRFRAEFLFAAIFGIFLMTCRGLRGDFRFFFEGFVTIGTPSPFQALIPTHFITIGPVAFCRTFAAIWLNHATRSENEIGLLSLMRNHRRSR